MDRASATLPTSGEQKMSQEMSTEEPKKTTRAIGIETPYKKSLTQFMWGFQQEFRYMAEASAERGFRLIDSEFTPSVVLVGLLKKDLPARCPVCVCPEDDLLNPGHFDKLYQRMIDALEENPRAEIIISDYELQQRHHSWAMKDARARGIENCVERVWPHQRPFCAMPVPVEDYDRATSNQLKQPGAYHTRRLQNLGRESQGTNTVDPSLPNEMAQ